jgi:hypothetical protein
MTRMVLYVLIEDLPITLFIKNYFKATIHQSSCIKRHAHFLNFRVC